MVNFVTQRVGLFLGTIVKQQQKQIITNAIVNNIKMQQQPLSYVYNIDYLQSSKATHYSQKSSISKNQQQQY